MAIEALKKDFSEKDSNKESIYNDIRTKVQHWKVPMSYFLALNLSLFIIKYYYFKTFLPALKNVARTKKAEIEALANENTILKESLIRASQPQPTTPPKVSVSYNDVFYSLVPTY